MKIIRLSAAFFITSLFLLACSSADQPKQTATLNTNPGDPALNEQPIDDYWAKDNLDLERVGNLLERSESPEEFERYLNDDDGINNLDLNGDGYADYISVEEYGDGDSESRGLSLFSRFGPEMIQEIATILLYRDGPNYPGARFLINGNEQLYGDNNYYETNWSDRAIPLVSTLFGKHDRYRSPYYYDNYPPDYRAYTVIDTPNYRTRIERLYPQPVFAYTNAPTFVNKIKIKSPNNGLHLGQIKARLVKPTKEQAEYFKSNPGRPKFGTAGKDYKPGRDDPPRSERGDDRGNPERDDRGAERGNPDQPSRGKREKTDNPNKGGGKPDKDDGPEKDRGKGKGDGNDQDKGGGKGKP